ncbi:hypothetical protein FQR65_LT15807 [Abscondita terminalis]|nr:hypothetical protein FQR65_LT15807 [Abscondita terminalis]
MVDNNNPEYKLKWEQLIQILNSEATDGAVKNEMQWKAVILELPPPKRRRTNYKQTALTNCTDLLIESNKQIADALNNVAVALTSIAKALEKNV